MPGWTPAAPRTITARPTPTVNDAIRVRTSLPDRGSELLFVVRNSGPEDVTLTWGRVDSGTPVLPNPLPALRVPAPEEGETTTLQFGPFNSQHEHWFVVLHDDEGTQDVIVDVYSRLTREL